MRTFPRVPLASCGHAAGRRLRLAALAVAFWAFLPAALFAQCLEAPPLAHFTGTSRAACPCFATGEQAGAVFTAPVNHYPLEILRVGIAWGSQFGGSPQSLEEAIHIYAAGLPNPGAPIFSLPGPVMTDGFINQFDLEPSAGEITVASGPFTVTLEFLTANAGNFFAPSVVHDANGCQAGRNVVFVPPATWHDACALSVSGDWVFFVVYRPCVTQVGVDDGPQIAMSRPVLLMPPRPNPTRAASELEFALARAGEVTLTVYDVGGRRVAVPAAGTFPAGIHRATWDGRTLDGARAAAGVYFVELRSGADRARRTVLIAE
jgi:hypothetical protein